MAGPVAGVVDAGVEHEDAAEGQVDTMAAGEFFAYAAEILKLQPPHITDQPILAQMRRIGIERGKSFDIDGVDAAIKAGLATAPEEALKLMAWKVSSNCPRGERLVDEHRHDGGLRQLLPEARESSPSLVSARIFRKTRSIRSVSRTISGKPMHGGSAYILHFDKGGTPPVDAFWSVTLYDGDGFQVANRLDRFAVSSWKLFEYNPDGSLDLYVQNASPGVARSRTGCRPRRGPSTSRCGSTHQGAMR